MHPPSDLLVLLAVLVDRVQSNVSFDAVQRPTQSIEIDTRNSWGPQRFIILLGYRYAAIPELIYGQSS